MPHGCTHRSRGRLTTCQLPCDTEKGEKMKLNDLIALAKQGYSLADIRELVSLADVKEQDETQQEEKDGSEETETEKDEGGEKEHEPEKDDDAVDYKALFMAEKEKVEKLQKQNIKKDNSGNEPENQEQILEDIFRNFM